MSPCLVSLSNTATVTAEVLQAWLRIAVAIFGESYSKQRTNLGVLGRTCYTLYVIDVLAHLSIEIAVIALTLTINVIVSAFVDHDISVHFATAGLVSDGDTRDSGMIMDHVPCTFETAPRPDT